MRVCLAIAFAVAFLATPVWSQSYQCAGSDPDWTLTLDATQGRFTFPAPTDMDVMLSTPAEGRAWPVAYTLIGERDTAIVLVEQEACQELAHRAHVLTQRGEAPILLTGCCSVAK